MPCCLTLLYAESHCVDELPPICVELCCSRLEHTQLQLCAGRVRATQNETGRLVAMRTFCRNLKIRF